MVKLAEIYDITKWGENGDPVWEFDITATPGQPTADPKIYWNPIPRQVCPILISGPVILISCHNNNKKPNWRFAGFINILIQMNILIQTENESGFNTFVSGKKIYLDEMQLIQLPQHSSEYGIAVDIAYWHNHFKLQCWDYRGRITTEELTEIARVRETQFSIIQNLQKLDRKLDIVDQNANY